MKRFKLAFSNRSYARLSSRAFTLIVGMSLEDRAWMADWLDFGSGLPAGADTNVQMLINHDLYPFGVIRKSIGSGILERCPR